MCSSDLWALAAGPISGGTAGTGLYPGTHGGGVFYSPNQGDFWFASNNGLANTVVPAMAVSLDFFRIAELSQSVQPGDPHRVQDSHAGPGEDHCL